MGTDLFDRFAVIDVDSHLTEPPDVWTARVPASRRDEVPHIERVDGQDVWMVQGERLGAPGYYSMAGHDGIMPASIPQTYDDIAPSMYDPQARLRFLDEQGIRAQVLYPNVGGFGNGYFLRLGDRELVAQCVMAYNDFLTDWTSADPDRLDGDHRTAVLGHRAVDRRDAALPRGTATRRSTSATSHRTTGSPRWPTRTGTRSGRPPRSWGSRSASTSAADRWAPSSSTPPAWGG